MLHNIFSLFIFLFVEALPLNQYLVFTHNIWTSAITLFRTATVAHSSCYTLQLFQVNLISENKFLCVIKISLGRFQTPAAICFCKR